MEKKLIIRPLVTAFIFFFCLLPSVGKAQTPVNCATAGALQAAINAAGAGATLLVSGIRVSRSSNARIAGGSIYGNGDDGIAVDRVSHANISNVTIGASGNGGEGVSVAQNSSVNQGTDTGTTILT